MKVSVEFMIWKRDWAILFDINWENNWYFNGAFFIGFQFLCLSWVWRFLKEGNTV